MSDITVKIENKKVKLEKTLEELNGEISMSIKFLQHLKNHSAEIVGNLNDVTTPAVYLKEYVDVNSFILKYLSLLTEINCKFEMLGISGNPDHNLGSVSGNFATSKTSRCNDKSNSQFDSRKCLPNLTNKENKKEELVESSCLSADNKSESVKNKFESFKKFAKIAHSDTKSESSVNSSSDIVKDSVGRSSTVIDPDGTSTSNEVQQLRIPLPNADSPDVPKEVIDHNYDRDIPKDFKSPQVSSVSHIKPPGQRNLEGKKKERIEIKELNISREIGVEYNVEVEQVYSPAEFYVTLKNYELDFFNEMMQKFKWVTQAESYIWEKYESKKAWLKDQMDPYVLFYSIFKGTWCRAKVIDWCLNYNEDFVKIIMLDYGEYKCVYVDDLELMPDCLKKYPACVVRCHLYGICPSEREMDPDTGTWGKESAECVRVLTDTRGEAKIKVAGQDDLSDISLPVTFWLIEEDNECINDILVEHNYAKYCTDGKETPTRRREWASEENEALRNWNPMKEDYESYENSYDLNVNDPATYIYGYAGQDYERVCKHFAKNGHCYKGKACRKEHKKLDRLGFTTDQEEVYKNAFNNLSIPPPKSVVNVHVTCLLGINNFCCILRDRRQSKEEENLQTLLKFMNKPENVQQMKKLSIPPSAGQIVIAQYGQDKAWYRAKVLESQPENDIYTVLFPDYGNKEKLCLANIRAIETRYLHLPFQAMKCFIYGVDRNPRVPLRDGMKYLNKRINKGHIKIEIVAKLPGDDATLLVHLIDENGKNVGADLISNKYAIQKDEMVVSTESESVPG